MRWDSFLPKSYKKSLVNCLVSRAWKLCSTFNLFHQELEFLKKTLLANGYPTNFVESIISKFLHKQYSEDLPTFGPNRKPVFFCLPFAGEEFTTKFARQLRRLLARVAPWIDLKIIFRPAKKLSCLTKVKSRLSILSNSGVVYKVSCVDCPAFYVGKTKRRLAQRLQEHQQQEYSALFKHSAEHAHSIAFETPEILATDTSDFRLSIKEAINILDHNAQRSLNANIRSCELSLF